jgi:hypothetical protein
MELAVASVTWMAPLVPARVGQGSARGREIRGIDQQIVLGNVAALTSRTRPASRKGSGRSAMGPASIAAGITAPFLDPIDFRLDPDRPARRSSIDGDDTMPRHDGP